MGFVTLEKSEKKDLFVQKKVPGAMSHRELKEMQDKNVEEQMAIREYVKELKNTGAPRREIETANQIWLALKTIHTQLSNLRRTASR